MKTSTFRGWVSEPNLPHSGGLVVTPHVEALPGARPRAQRRAQLLATEEGAALAGAVRQQLADAIGPHDIAPMAALRLRAGLSQEQLAALTGIAQPHLSRIENGRSESLTTNTLNKLAEALIADVGDVSRAFDATVQRRRERDGREHE